MKRIKELDLIKTFLIIISMIGIHTMCHLANLDSSILTSALNVLSTDCGAPVFMFCMGMTLGFSRHQEPADWFRRGIHLITVGMTLNLVRYLPVVFKAHATDNPELMKLLAQMFIVDILQFAGLAFMLLALCKKLMMSEWQMLVLSIVLNIVGTILVRFSTSSYIVNQFLGYFYHTRTCSCFPLFNWFIFVASGNLMGKIYRESKDIDRMYRYVMPVCGIIAIVHQYLSITGQVPFFRTRHSIWNFYSMTTPDALCIAFGIAPFMLSVFRLVARIIPDKWMEVLGYPSVHINQYYCISWVWIVWIACFLYFINPATTISIFVLSWFVIVVLTTITTVIYDQYLKPLVTPIFSRHETAWTIGVWVVAIVFGIFYFTSVLGPYIMPY